VDFAPSVIRRSGKTVVLQRKWRERTTSIFKLVTRKSILSNPQSPIR
jgi:hypothetical protein